MYNLVLLYKYDHGDCTCRSGEIPQTDRSVRSDRSDGTDGISGTDGTDGTRRSDRKNMIHI